MTQHLIDIAILELLVPSFILDFFRLLALFYIFLFCSSSEALVVLYSEPLLVFFLAAPLCLSAMPARRVLSPLPRPFYQVIAAFIRR